MFSLLRADKGNNPAIKEMAVAAATYGIGEVLAESNGLLTKVTGTVKPAYVSCGVGTKASGDLLAVNPIYKDMEFTTTLAATGALKVGEKVKVVDGPFKNMYGKIESVDLPNSSLTVLIDLFGQETPVEVTLSQVEKA